MFAECGIFYDHHSGRADNIVHSGPAKRQGTLDEDRVVIDFVFSLQLYVGTSVERELVCTREKRDLVEVMFRDGGMGGEDMSVPIQAFALRVLAKRIEGKGDPNTYQYLIVTDLLHTTN